MINDPQASYREQLLAIRQDPRVRRLALSHAGDPDLAEDALQEAYYALVRARDTERIVRNLRAYFCTVLIREARHLRGQLGAALAEDFESLAGEHQGDAALNPAPPRPFDETVGITLLGQTWLERFAVQRQHLRNAVPGRSSDPDRYRDLIVAVAEQVLRDLLNGDDSEADSSEALRAAYPEWFGAECHTANTVHQRSTRARTDVRNLLRTLISHDVIDLPLHHAQEDSRTLFHNPARREDTHRPADRSVTGTSRRPQGLLRATAQQDEHMRTSDDEILKALFHEAEQTRLPYEMPYNLERELQLFTAWLDRKVPNAPSKRAQDDPS